MTEQEIRKTLLAKKQEVTDLLNSNAEDAAPVELDQSQQGRLSRMDAIQQQAMAAETQRRRQRDVHLLDAALKRLDEGEYGYCVNCGEAIGTERLALDPATPFCIAHAV
ncbi:TraR/DksA C4-type zinc finger protein [Alphaproteobacteria bacterium]|nr:molecular chaperone DnaK [Rhodobiaceae bacterium]MBL6642130.1 TraR/DksA C4-type zinc finger protein [PS1 clade bacterium]MDA8524515.1 TraR/DksA C4-type zinc finger protein [Alphaproteobacteria bacterium]MDA8622595.1 TraR/DksA C4-type zinc finger protein [bacterium]RPF94347.1 MAG: TraR/DksA family transcriptional regulator [Rhizobiales bacterium TMED162]